MKDLNFVAARVMPYPHGSLCVSGDEKWLLSSRKTEKYSEQPVLVIENSHAVGIINLRPVGFRPISALYGENAFQKHQHTKQEIETWWSDLDELWIDEVIPLLKFKRPIPVNYPKEAKVWVTPENVEFISMFKRHDWVDQWREAWENGEWDTDFLWEILGIDDFTSLDIDPDKIEDALLFVLVTQGNPDLDVINLGRRSHSIQTILDFQDWNEVETESLKLAFEILSLMDDEEYRNIAIKRISEELNSRGVEVKPEFEKIVFSFLPTLSDKQTTGSASKKMLEIFKDGAILYKNAVLAVGSVIDQETGNDIDILIKNEIPVELAQRIAFRIGRACASLRDTKFHIFRGDGPITSYIPLYDIALIPTKREVVKMQYVPESILFSPMEPMKPIRPGKESTIEAAIDLIEQSGLHGYCQPKVDGIHAFIHVGPNDRKAFSDDGNDITESLQSILNKLPDGEYILDGEIETWVNGEHQPREQTAGNVKSGNSANFVLSVFDCFYHNGQDLRQLGFHKRLEHLEEICSGFEKTMGKPKTDLVLLPSFEVKTRHELEVAIKNILAHKEKEGFIWKAYNGPYIPNHNRGYQIKWHRHTTIRGVVLNRIETRVPGVFNYEWGILIGDIPTKRSQTLNGENYLVIGRTFSSKTFYNVGDEILVEAETVNLIIGDGSIDLTAWAPKIVEEV